MVSHVTPSADKQASGKTGSSHGRDRTAGTPRKDGNPGKEKGVQDPGLKDYVCAVVGGRGKR